MIPQFKIRCSAIGKIMGEVNRPTEKQLKLLAELEAKEKRTEAQERIMKELQAKRDAKPCLSAGAKTYCEQWLKEQMGFYNRTAEFSNKYTERGVICEPMSIALIAMAMGYGEISKNEDRYEDDDITGTPDLVLGKTVEDAKTSWDWKTFPLFKKELPESDYFYQLQGYMALTDKARGAVNYCLIDTPEEFIEREARYASMKAGYDEVDMELYDEVAAKMTYGDVPLSLRFKRYEIERDDSVIAAIRSQVALCRVYIAELCKAYLPLHDVSYFATPIDPQTTLITAE